MEVPVRLYSASQIPIKLLFLLANPIKMIVSPSNMLSFIILFDLPKADVFKDTSFVSHLLFV